MTGARQGDDSRTVTIAGIGDLNALTSRRGFLRLMGLGGALVLLPGVLASCSDSDSISAPVSGSPLTIDFANGDVALLQFAYLLEQLEADFYARVVDNLASSDITVVSDQALFVDLRNHEAIHRDLLKTVLGANANFTLTPTYRGVNFRSRASVLAAAKTFEDLGVAAYNGAAQYLSDAGNLLLASKIVSVEARHASAIRDLLNPKSGDFAPSAFDDAFRPSRVASALRPFAVDVLTFANTPATFVQGPNGNG